MYQPATPSRPSPCPRQVVLLDPVLYPGALKAFAREVCKNDMLNFGRMHWFFPDSRLALDLNTDKTLKVRAPGGGAGAVLHWGTDSCPCHCMSLQMQA
jgi:hypothetical protein